MEVFHGFSKIWVSAVSQTIDFPSDKHQFWMIFGYLGTTILGKHIIRDSTPAKNGCGGFPAATNSVLQRQCWDGLRSCGNRGSCP